jgi:DNA-binding NarL/FixJ family response regulator
MTGREGNMSNIRVLVVDDHDLFRTGLSSLLAAEPDIEVVAQASGGHAGVRLAHELRPDVVLMDLRLPDLPAPAATREILSAGPSTRVVVLTVPPGDEDVEEAVRAGACGFLAKETPIEAVVTAVRAAAQGVALFSPRAAEVVLGQLPRTSRPRKSSDKLEGDLSPPELDVLRLLERGLDVEQIAAELNIRPRTAKNHLASILHKLNRGWRGPGPGPEGSSGVREPRRPLPQTGGGSAQVQPPTQ